MDNNRDNQWIITDDTTDKQWSITQWSAAETALGNFKKGVHKVYDEILDLEGNHVSFCNIVRECDLGDSSVGIGNWEGWVLSDDQSNTKLEVLIAAYNKLNRIREIMEISHDDPHQAVDLVNAELE